MKNKLMILLYPLAILFGIFAFIAGEIDDSPGAQLIGVIVIAYSIYKIFSKVRING